MVFGPVVQVTRKGADSRVVWCIIPPLHKPAMAILPMMPIPGHLKSPLDCQPPFGHLDEVPSGPQHAIPVMPYLFELGIAYRSPHDLHVTDKWTRAQKGIQLMEVRLHQPSVAARNVAIRSWYRSTSS